MKMIGITATMLLTLLAFGCSSEDGSKSKSQSGTPTADTTAKTRPQDDGKVTIDFTKIDPNTKQIKLEYQMSDIPFTLEGKPLVSSGISFTPALEWTTQTPDEGWLAYYTYGPLADEADSACLVVKQFDKVEDLRQSMIDWVEQMSFDDGRDPQKASIKYTIESAGMPVHVVSTMGIYNVPDDRPKYAKKIQKPNYRYVLIGVEGPTGNLLFKLTGPDYTAKIMTEPFFISIKTKLKKV